MRSLVALAVSWLVLVGGTVVPGVASAAPGAPGAERSAPPAAERRAITDEVAGRVMCPSCDTTLDRSDSPAADRMRAYIRARADEGWTADEIVDGLMVEYGGDGSILAAPRADTGRGMLAWGVPLAVAMAALLGGGLSVRRWRRAGVARRASRTDRDAAVE